MEVTGGYLVGEIENAYEFGTLTAQVKTLFSDQKDMWDHINKIKEDIRIQNLAVKDDINGLKNNQNKVEIYLDQINKSIATSNADISGKINEANDSIAKIVKSMENKKRTAKEITTQVLLLLLAAGLGMLTNPSGLLAFFSGAHH